MKTITEETYVNQAEKVILTLSKKVNPRNNRPIPIVSTSKLRNLLSMTSDIYNEVVKVRTDELPEDIKSRIEYLRIRFIYEAGREDKVKALVEEAGILNVLQEIQGKKGNYLLFSRYMEALVAFRKFYGGKDE